MNVETGPIDCLSHCSDYSEAQARSTCNVCLKAGSRTGLLVGVLASAVSLVSLLVLLGVIARNYRRKRACCPHRNWQLFRRNIDIFIFNLIMGDIVTAVGSLASTRWVLERQVYCGTYCDIQATLNLVGLNATVLSTLAIAVITFIAVRLNSPMQYNPRMCIAAVLAIWLWPVLWAIIPLETRKGLGVDAMGNVQGYFTPVPWYCFINTKYKTYRLVSAYLPIWISGLASILYFPAVLVVYRSSAAQSSRQQHEGDGASVSSFRNTDTFKLLSYPAVYSLFVLPMFIMRSAMCSNPKLSRSPHAILLSMLFLTLWELAGFMNVVLTLYVRPAVLLLSYDGEPNLNVNRQSADAGLETFRASPNTSAHPIPFEVGERKRSGLGDAPFICRGASPTKDVNVLHVEKA